MGTYFCVRHKSRLELKWDLKLLFFKLNLHFGTSDVISTCKKLNLLPINSIYMVVFSRWNQRRPIQTKAHFMFFNTIRIKTTHKPSKVAAVRNFFSSVIDATCFDDCFLFHAITLFFKKVWCYFAFLETSFWKEINQGHRHWRTDRGGGAPAPHHFLEQKKFLT